MKLLVWWFVFYLFIVILNELTIKYVPNKIW